MECNKDEALRAKHVAESKMQRGDFEGGLKFALKAKNMYAEVENIAHILTVCEVHIASQNKLSVGSEMDWYGILQTGQLADEATIKKQYRKLALLLHPDKNKFAGAEAAFKLIGEANRVLGDKANRSLYDMKYKASLKPRATKTSSYHSNRNAFPPKHNGNRTNYQSNSFSNFTFLNRSVCVGPDTFMTLCKHCNSIFQYTNTKNTLNIIVCCPKCLNSFTPGLGYPDIPSKCKWESLQSKIWKEAQKDGAPKPASESNGGGHADNFVPVSMKKCVGAGVGGRHKGKKTISPKKGEKTISPEKGKKTISPKKGKKTITDYFATDRAKGNFHASKGAEEMRSQSPTNVGSKRVRQSAPDSGESFNADSGESFNAGFGNGMKDANAQVNGVDSSRLNARRSSRQKPNVSYAETQDNDDPESPPKKPRQNEPFNTDEFEKRKASVSSGLCNNKNPTSSGAGVVDKDEEVRNKVSNPPEEAVKDEQSHVEKEMSKLDPGFRSSKEEHDVPSEAKVIGCPDAEFNDFEKDKTEDCFAVNQFWAIYDPADAMPRYYALVRKKVASPFKLKVTWLEADSDNQDEADWQEANLPIASGMFSLSRTQDITDISMFSHQMHCRQGSSRGSYLVYPKMGETWAIFRDWDIKWSSNAEMHSKFEYEYVEILSDFAVNVGIEVAYLGKVKGFVSLFERLEKNEMNTFHVIPSELYRFSHRIPSHKMTGDERVGVPRGSFELDPAAMPTSLFEDGGCNS